jgi:hypothetical protein
MNGAMSGHFVLASVIRGLSSGTAPEPEARAFPKPTVLSGFGPGDIYRQPAGLRIPVRTRYPAHRHPHEEAI